MKRTKKRAQMEERVADLLLAGVRPIAPVMTNSLGMRLALVPAGRFRMGSPAGEKERDVNETPHEVVITRAFYLGIHPVTQAQYKAVIGSNPSHFCATGNGRSKVSKLDTSDFPVDSVSWEDASEFCRQLSEREGRPYRLPTEAEWEYAARGGSASTTAFHLGNSISSRHANFNGANPYNGGNKGRSLGRPCSVGSYLANVFGLHDMGGNVWQWCSDWFADYPSGPVTDPTGPDTGRARAMRGCGYYFLGRGCRAADRSDFSPTSRHESVGFRIALTAG
jgi:formylglycine-generating enzyme required for sulfatase activity